MLCGPGNNGGDGYVAARLLGESGVAVRLWRAEAPRAGTDAAQAAAECPVEAKRLEDFQPDSDCLVIDALFGAGLSKPLAGVYGERGRAQPQVGRHGPGRRPAERRFRDRAANCSAAAMQADLTVTFFRKKPGHLLYPGRQHCGETIVADIGIGDGVLDAIRPRCFENGPALWGDAFRARRPRPTNMPAAMSACFPAARRRRARRGCRQWAPRASGPAR